MFFLIFIQMILWLFSEGSVCSELSLTQTYTDANSIYSIVTQKLPSSNMLQVTLLVQESHYDTAWFLMGATDRHTLLGSWQPVTSNDGHVIDCALSTEENRVEIVSNANITQSYFTFFWMPSPIFNGTIFFIATIVHKDRLTGRSSSQFIQSYPITIDTVLERQRYQDVNITFCNSSPCLNGGTCIIDPQYSFCQCIPPWNGFRCQLQYFHILLGSNLTYGSDFYFNTLNSPTYAALSADLFTWFNNSLTTLPVNRFYSINFVSPSPFGVYISVTMALTPTTTPFAATIQAALQAAITRNATTPLGRVLTISSAFISTPVELDGAPYTSCVFPFALTLVDYNFCIPLSNNFVCSRSRVIDRNTTFNSLDCSRNLFNYIVRDPCFPNICLNGGTCTTVGTQAICNCPEFFTGNRCEQLFGCNPLINSRAVSCTNSATCVANRCVCASNDTIGTLCEIPSNTGCSFPFTFMNVTYESCAVISGQSLCVARGSGLNGQFPVSMVACGAPQCQNNPCANRGTCQNTASGSFRCLNCASGFSGYFCEMQFRTYQLALNITYNPDFRNLSSNASQIILSWINRTLTSTLFNVTSGGFRPDLISIVQNPDGTASAVINVVTNFINFLNNATQNALDRIGAISIALVNTTRECAPWYIYEGRNVSGCVTNAANVPICSLTDNFDRDGQFTTCSEPINLNLCNAISCGDGRCIVTSRNITYCRCSPGVTGANCDQLIQCNDINCLNNGTCVSLTSGFFRCNCPPGLGGTYCQFNTSACRFPFADNFNRTYNTCITSNDFMNGTIPWCQNALGQRISCLIDYCASRPCVYGTCIPASRWAFGNSFPSFICNCTAGYTGRLCTHAYFRLKVTYAAGNLTQLYLNALESPTTQTYRNLTLMFRNLVRNRTNSSFDFLPLLYTVFRLPDGNFYQVTSDVSFPGNMTPSQIYSILAPILTNLPVQFNVTYFETGTFTPDEIQRLNPAANCTLPYGYDGLSLAVCRMDINGLPYCSYGQNYTDLDRKLCDASGLPTAQYTACSILNNTNPCNSTPDFPIRCVGADDGWNCFCEVTQTLGKDCANLDFCRNGSLLCRNNATCINRPDLRDFACNCTDPYYGRFCENFGIGYRLFLVNYSNLTSPGNSFLIASINQTIVNITRGAVIATNIIISPSGEVTLVVTGRNYSIPELELALLNRANSNWTAGPYVVTYNRTDLIPIQTNATCVFPFAYNGVNYTTCITTGYGFPWCSATPVFTGRIVDCRNIDWCASGPCLNNGTCRNNLVTGGFECICADGWLGVRCAYPSTTITIVLPWGNNTYNNQTFIDIGRFFPNNTNSTFRVDTIRPGPNNTIIITIIVNGSFVPNITIPNALNTTTVPTDNIPGCVFPFTYGNRTYTTCIPIGRNRSTFCCQNSNCDLNPQWQFCNDSTMCAACAPAAGCTTSSTGVITCTCPAGFSGTLCDTPLDLCSLSNRSCLNNGTCVVNPLTSAAVCNCSSPLYAGTRCELYLPCLLSPCQNNGICLPGPNGTVICNCTNCYGGPLCQNIDYCCLNVCSPNGICLPGINNSYTCICQPNYTGQNCTILNACASNPCVFGGTCLSSGNNSFICLCPTNYFGLTCNQSLCTNNPCVNGGACQLLTNGTQGYICLCPPNYGGQNCSLLNPCAALPCQNNGTCVYLNGTSFQCICPTGWTGTTCTTVVNPCASGPCRNNGQCVSLGTTFLCVCPIGFTGTLCETLINPCSSNPCLNNGTCFQQFTNASLSTTGSPLGFICICNQTLFSGTRCEIIVSPCPTVPGAPSPCRNGGTCVPSANGRQFSCFCPYPYTGDICDQLIDPCATNPCSPNGLCFINLATSNYTCVCVNATFTGPQCQNLTNPCLSSPCVNGSTCITNGTRFICQCPANRTGVLCESILPPCTNTTCFNNGTCLYSGNFVTCVCPPAWTGPQCLQPNNPCLLGPCLNNGTCFNQLSNSFFCQCPPTWTGNVCQTPLNPCANYPCFFGGTCLVNSFFQPVCICPPTQTGIYCQTTLSPCLSNPCVNNGTCFSTSTLNSYTCVCPPLYTGGRCENMINPCLTNRCLFGTCFALNNGSYYCACIANYTGMNCDIPIDPCSLLPCVNNGTCLTLGTTYQCLCPTGYTGRSCEQINNPCLSNPCRRGTCLSSGTRFVCACDAASTGVLCEIPLDPCLSLPCLNNQTCNRDSTNTSYICLCAYPYTGQRCATTILPCSTVLCFNGGTCVQTGLSTTQCLCPVGFSGTFCELTVNPCQSQPCVNNGTCLSTFNNSYVCLCPPSYTGVLCERFNPCATLTCLNGGTCVISSLDIGGRTCLCPAGWTGQVCAIPVSPCTATTCVNNGICVVIPGTSNFTCVCPSSFTGTYCQTFLNPCLTYACANGGTCYRTADGTPLCACLPTFTGALCLTQLDPCLSNPCVNNGVCISLLPVYNYTCRCPANFTGLRCESLIGACSTSLCQNGGTCVVNGLNTALCICPPIWTGTLCTQRIDPCITANPCLNSGICIAVANGTNRTVALCQCLAGFTGQYCEQRVSACQTLPCINGQCLLRADGTPLCYCNPQWTGSACDTLISPCVSQPCLNNGVCMSTGLNYTCICPQGYFGIRCESVSPTICTLICTNNGTCAIRGTDNVQVCICPTGFTGTRCEIAISPCIPSPCLNNGICIPITTSSGALNYSCNCPPPYTGLICSTIITTLCGNFTCLNGGTCFIVGNQTICQCLPSFTGQRCENFASPCASQPCVNSGTCQVVSLGRKKRQTTTALGYVCQCLALYTGPRCETVLSLCASNPCQNNGTCFQDIFSNTIRCICPPNFTGVFCNIIINTTNVCTANPGICVNGGTCRVNSSSALGFSCACPPTSTGIFCEQPLDSCRPNGTSICANNGTCVSTSTGLICICPTGFTGPTCSVIINPCSSQPCFRNGTCLVTGLQSYLCVCPTGFFGTRCEICDCPCNIYPCVNGGVCRSTAVGGVVCICPTGFTGVRCEISTLPCDSNPCLNRGVCLYDPTTLIMTCQCCGLATGRFCETILNPCNTSIPYCFNGGTCGLDASNSPVCICPSTYTGRYCETYSNPCALVTCIQGTCAMMSNSTFLCLCPPGRSGRFCEIIDPCVVATGAVPPCRNGGTCIRLGGTSYACTCPIGFTGAYCDIANPCASLPCNANATCVTLMNGTAICICPVGMTGVRCDQRITNGSRVPCPTANRPTLTCANGGTCVPGLGCFCQVGFAGDDCETPIYNSCTSTTCLNGGTCRQFINGTIVCVCPIGFTGTRCETSLSLCLPNPCQFNGTCVLSGTTGYICLCPPGFTGPQCNLVNNPCLYSPCQDRFNTCVNGGTCAQLSNGGYICICPSGFTGTQCQTILNPCLSYPCNTGTCITIGNGLGYVCNCPAPLTGPNCLSVNPCSYQPCLNGGTCIISGASTYTCICPTNYIGTHCQTLSLCSPNPCLNNGTCTMLTVSSISCTCSSTFYGDRCQYLNPCRFLTCIRGVCQVNPITLTAQCACLAGWTGAICDIPLACSSNPCIYGTCVSLTTGTGYICNCMTGYYGPQCQYSFTQSPCLSNPCRNGGTCQIITNGYICTCPAAFVGTYCEIVNPCLSTGSTSSTCQAVLTSTGIYICSCSSNPCASNPCVYGTCSVINNGLAYRCLCCPSFLGPRCNIPDPCLAMTCYNGGYCLSTLNSAGTQATAACQCPSSQSFLGSSCETYNPCISSPCLNGGTCISATSITSYYVCTCPQGFSGERCQMTITQTRCETVGLTNNCRNGGTCMLMGTTTRCICTSAFTGSLCESATNLCSLGICQNGGICLGGSGSSIVCQCPPNFQGQYCEYSTDPCANRPCLNGGQCIASGISFVCNCAWTSYTGSRCETLISTPCLPNPCSNGGTCQTISSTFICLCPTGFTGTLCTQSLSVCATVQCLNGGTCVNYGTFAVCTCLSTYTGDRCQYVNQCLVSSPCLFGGTCIPVMNSFSCQCPTGRTGTTCQFLSDNPCSGKHQCQNDGTCQLVSGTAQAGCLCPTGFTGSYCEQEINSITTTRSASSVTIIPQLILSATLETTSSIYFNRTDAPYTCDDISLACLAYSSFCAREIEFGGIPCRVLCPRTCNTCCEDFYTNNICSLEKCQRNPELERYCRKTCICKQ